MFCVICYPISRLNEVSMKPGNKNITGVILAGGRAERMSGKDKALLQVQGQRIIDRLIAQLRLITDDIIISSNSEEDYGLDYPVYKDIYTGKGPIGGIHSALSYSSSNMVFFFFLINDSVFTVRRGTGSGRECSNRPNGFNFKRKVFTE